MSGSMALRLPADARDAFFDKYGTRLAEQYGRTMKEYALEPNRPPVASPSPALLRGGWLAGPYQTGFGSAVEVHAGPVVDIEHDRKDAAAILEQRL